MTLNFKGMLQMAVSNDVQERFVAISRKVEALNIVLSAYQDPEIRKPDTFQARLTGICQ